jgi:hypothetical protein
LVTVAGPDGKQTVLYGLIDEHFITELDRTTSRCYTLSLSATMEERCAAMVDFWSSLFEALRSHLGKRIETSAEDKWMHQGLYNNLDKMTRVSPADMPFPFPPFSFTLLHLLDNLWNSQSIFFSHVSPSSNVPTCTFPYSSLQHARLLEPLYRRFGPEYTHSFDDRAIDHSVMIIRCLLRVTRLVTPNQVSFPAFSLFLRSHSVRVRF